MLSFEREAHFCVEPCVSIKVIICTHFIHIISCKSNLYGLNLKLTVNVGY
jgi:hypothetical protein